MGLPMIGQTMVKFSLNQIPTLNHKFTIANSFIILIRLSITAKFELWAFWKFALYAGGIMKAFCL